MKKTITEIFAIALIAGLFGLVYNYFIPSPFPLVMKKKEVAYVTDDSLEKMMQSYINDSLQNGKSGQVAEAQAKTTVDTSLAAKSVKKDTASTALKTADAVQGDNKPKEAKSIRYDQLVKFLGKPNIVLVDARNPENFEKGHIGKAINIYPEDQQDDYFRKLTQLPNDKLIIVYCDGGQCELSHHVAKDLLSFGYDRVLIYTGGWEEWQKKNPKI